jgi:hypothetical protein
LSTATDRHDPWTHETRTRNGPWRLALLNTGCTCGWGGPTYDLHDMAAGLAHDEATWAHQDHIETSGGRATDPLADGCPAGRDVTGDARPARRMRV